MFNIFVSSTFRDMQNERDVINRTILPRLRFMAGERGTSISFTDLRWGINTENLDEQKEMEKILDVCIKEIDEAHPYFLVLIGDRYGTIPNPDVVKSFLNSKPGKSYVPDEVAGKSVTALEIMHATHHLSRTSSKGIVICIREICSPEKLPGHVRERFMPETEEERRRVDGIKKELCELFPGAVLRYKISWDEKENKFIGMEGFGNMLYERISNSIKDDLPPSPASSWEKRKLKADEILRRNGELLVPFKEADSNCRWFLESGRILMVFGETGSGKTMQLSAIAKIANQNGDLVIPLMEPLINETGILDEFLKDIVFNLNDEVYDIELAKEKISTAWLKNKVQELADEIGRGKKIVFLIDDFDKYDAVIRTELLRELPIRNDSVRVVITGNSADVLPEFVLENYIVSYMNVGASDSEFIRHMTRKLLDARGKELSADLHEVIVNASLYRTPLYTGILVDYICGLGKEDFSQISQMENITNVSERISRYLIDIIDTLPTSETLLAQTLLYSIESYIGKGLADFLKNLLSMFPDGLRIVDLLEIYGRAFPDSGISELDLVLFIENAPSVFQRESEWILFRHNLFSPDAEYCRHLLPVIRDYMTVLQIMDPLKIREYLPVTVYFDRYDLAASFLRDCHEAIPSLKRRLFLDEGRPLTDTVKKILEQAKIWSMQDVLNLVSAFLYSYDEIFQQLNSESKQEIMEQLYCFCADTVYEEVWDHVKIARIPQFIEQYRICYVCCEQRGIRADNYGLMKEMYLEFHSKCVRLLRLMKPEDPFYDDVLQDYCISIEKISRLHSFRIEERMSMMDEAYDCLINHVTPENEERFKRFKIHFMFNKAEILVDKACMNKRIGWPDDILTEHLEEVTKAALNLADFHISAGDFRNKNGEWICKAYRVLTDVYLSIEIPAPDKELFYMHMLLNSAREWYRSSGETMALDMIRNSCLRLVLNDESMPLDEKCRYINEACRAGVKMKDKIQPEDYYRVQGPVIKQVIKCYGRLISKLEKENEINQKIEAAKVGCEAIEVLYLDEVFISIFFIVKHDDKLYNDSGFMNLFNMEDEEEARLCTSLFQDIFSSLARNIDIVYKKMIDVAQRGKYEDAIVYAKLLERCIEEFDLVTNDYKFMEVVRYYYRGIAAVYHNYGVDGPPVGMSFRELSDKEYYYLEKAALYNNRLLLMEPNKEASCEEFRKHDLGAWWTTIESNVWLRTAAYALGEGGILSERFLEIVFKQWCFGGRYVYLISAAFRKPEGDVLIEKIGKYMTDHIDDEKVLKFLVLNDLFEATTLEYAYRKNMLETAHKIIYNCYQGYLELPMLYIIRRYDRKEYERIFPGLADGCLKRLKKDLRIISDLDNSEYNDFIDVLTEDIDEREIKYADKMRERPLEADYDCLYAASEGINGTYAPVIVFVEKNGRIQFADCILTGASYKEQLDGFRILSERMKSRGYRRTGKIFCKKELRKEISLYFSDCSYLPEPVDSTARNIKMFKSVQRIARKVSKNQMQGKALSQMTIKKLLVYLTECCVNKERE